MRRSTTKTKILYGLLLLLLLILLQPTGGKWAWIHGVRWLYVFLLSFGLSFLLTPLAEMLAQKFKILDLPDHDRKIHTMPIPRLGGLAVFAAFLISATRNDQFSMQLGGLIFGGCIIYAIGFFDDKKPLPAAARLSMQIIACLVVIYSGVFITVIPKEFDLFRVPSSLLTIFWLLGLSNALNFLDGVDGLATGMAALCSILFFMIALPTNQTYLSYSTMALAGACLGFLPYNWRPAKIFLGDAGSTFLGFMIAGFAVMGSWADKNGMVAVSTPLLILGIPIFDMIYTTVSRIKNGSVKTFIQWLEYAGKDHFHHRLMHLGFSQVQTVGLILLLNFCLGLGALTLRETGTRGSIFLLSQSVLIFLIVVALMLRGRNNS
jgi:UDP-GlcNAc:undecaprenyl-phosphate/decaprenyl-phosphate GlcNAc-1-phosphate transferase